MKVISSNQKGSHVTEAYVLTNSNNPVSIFSKIYSAKEKFFLSVNVTTFEAMERGATMFSKATLLNRRKGKVKTPLFYRGKNTALIYLI